MAADFVIGLWSSSSSLPESLVYNSKSGCILRSVWSWIAAEWSRFQASVPLVPDRVVLCYPTKLNLIKAKICVAYIVLSCGVGPLAVTSRRPYDVMCPLASRHRVLSACLFLCLCVCVTLSACWRTVDSCRCCSRGGNSGWLCLLTPPHDASRLPLLLVSDYY